MGTPVVVIEIYKVQETVRHIRALPSINTTSLPMSLTNRHWFINSLVACWRVWMTYWGCCLIGSAAHLYNLVTLSKVTRNTALKRVCCEPWSAALTGTDSFDGSQGLTLCGASFCRRRTRIGISSSCERKRENVITVFHLFILLHVWWSEKVSSDDYTDV